MPGEFRMAKIFFSLFGFLGVEVFFVLSGFLIGKILFRQFSDNPFDFRAVTYFLKRRWFRTLPNYFLVLVLNIVIGLGVIGYKIDGLWCYFFFLQNFSVKVPAFFPESWSLSVEEFAYVILPVAMWSGVAVFAKADKKKLFLQITVFVYCIFIGTKIWYSLHTDFTTLSDWNLYLKSVVIYRIDAIVTGVVAAWIALNRRDFWYRTRWMAAFSGVFFAVLLIFGSSIFKVDIASNHFFWDVVFLPLLSLSIGAMLPLFSAWKSQPFGIGKPITYIALISYAMYLLHYSVVMQLLHAFLFPTLGWMATGVLYLVLTFGLSALLYHLFEKLVMDLRDKRTKT